MKKTYVTAFALTTVFIYLLSCSGTRSRTPSAIGLLPLEGYQPAPTVLTTDTSYRVFRSEEAFNRNFAATAQGTRRPAFEGQAVVAILLKAAPAVPLRFERAEVVGTAIHVFAQACTQPDCIAGQAVLATIPNVGRAREVQFFVDGRSVSRQPY